MFQNGVSDKEGCDLSPEIDEGIDFDIEARHPGGLLDVEAGDIALDLPKAHGARVILNERTVVVGNGIDMGHPGKEDLSSSSETGKGMGNNASNADLEIAGHHLLVDRDRRPPAGLAEIGAKIEGW